MRPSLGTPPSALKHPSAASNALFRSSSLDSEELASDPPPPPSTAAAPPSPPIEEEARRRATRDDLCERVLRRCAAKRVNDVLMSLRTGWERGGGGVELGGVGGGREEDHCRVCLSVQRLELCSESKCQKKRERNEEREKRHTD